MSDPYDSISRPGRVIAGKYRLTLMIGRGGMGSIWRAEHLELGAPVAIKIVDARLLGSGEHSQEVLGRFVREARAVAALRSPHVVQLLDYGVDAGTPYMVLELLEGETLERRLERQRVLSRPEVVRVITHIARALMRAHEANIAHRDLKPSNVFLVRDEDEEIAKVLDFGIAKRVEQGMNLGNSQVTGAGRVLGTPAYMSPEQMLGNEINLRTDLWALGVIAFECICGRRPFDAAAPGALMMQICTEPAPIPSKVAPVPRGFDAWFQRATQKYPSQRFGSAREMVDAMRSWAEDDVHSPPTGSKPVAPVAPIARTPVSQSSSRWIVFALPAIVALVIAGVWLGRSPAPTNIAASASAATTSTATPTVVTSATQNPASARPGTCPERMVLVAGGSFMMGSDDAARSLARPVHKVMLDSFCLDAFEVTAGDYAACVERGACERPPSEPDYPNTGGASVADHERMKTAQAELCTFGKPGLTRHPINCVSFMLADAYCHQAGARLPTEAEWELAARGGGMHEAPWGDDPGLAGRVNACGLECVRWEKQVGMPAKSRAYDEDDGWAGTAPVGSFPRGATPSGIQDLLGNVWEWTADWYATYKPDEAVNPKGARGGERKAIRGGGFNAAERGWIHPAYRYHQLATASVPAIGFRCARDL